MSKLYNPYTGKHITAKVPDGWELVKQGVIQKDDLKIVFSPRGPIWHHVEKDNIGKYYGTLMAVIRKIEK